MKTQLEHVRGRESQFGELNNYLPALQQQTSVHRSQPHHSVASLEVAQFTAAIAQVNAQAFQ